VTDERTDGDDVAPSARGAGRSAQEVFSVFLSLGCTSFGGPIAHLGFFHEKFVKKDKWIDEKTYADLVALCQFLPGPASSQLGMIIGLRECGLRGALAAFVGFTLPSAVIMLLAAYGVSLLQGPVGGALVHGLKVAAVAIVAQAVWSMAQNLCPDRVRAGFAISAASFMLVVPSVISQILVILAGAIAGNFLLEAQRRSDTPKPHQMTRDEKDQVRIGFGLFFGILAVAPLLAAGSGSQFIAMFDAFYRTGSLVFGGGHIVLPLLEREVVGTGWVDAEVFLAGYGIAQAIPGPLFTFATFLGATSADPPNGIAGATLATVAIFVPAFLLVWGGLPLWDRLRAEPRLRAALMGTNAAVVGLLLAALYDPVWTSAIEEPADFALAMTAFGLLTIWKLPAFTVVAITALGGVVLPYLSFF